MAAQTKEVTYSAWKVLAWRFVRAGVAGGIGNILALTIVLKQDLSNSQVYISTLISAFVAGFVSAGGLALRDSLSDNNKESAIQKLPI